MKGDGRERMSRGRCLPLGPYMTAKINLQRTYEPPDTDDGRRFLVDRLWPRGVARKNLALDAWVKDVAPSTELRKWFGHDPDRWVEFQKRYRHELDDNKAALQPLLDAAAKEEITLVYGARDTAHNEAVVLRDYLLEHL